MAALQNERVLRVSAVRAEELESFLPLIESHQRFAEVPPVDRGRNRGFFGRLIAPSHLGALLGAWQDEKPIGFACLHWSLDSLRARETVTLFDLWVEPGCRGRGVGHALIQGSAELARERGAHALMLRTPPENSEARRLFESLAGDGEDLTQYELQL